MDILEQTGQKPLSLVLRRFEGEAIELVTANLNSMAANDQKRIPCRIPSGQDRATVVYNLLLPDNLNVRPVDWRRFAYDHAKVKELLSVCVRDNLAQTAFEPWSDELRQEVEATIMMAAGDLSSVFDVQSIHCERPEDNLLRVTIIGEHKNGECVSYSYVVDRDQP